MDRNNYHNGVSADLSDAIGVGSFTRFSRAKYG